MCAEIDNPWGQIYSRVWLATGLLDHGDYDAALAVAQAGQRQAKAHHLPAMRLFIALVLGKIYRAVGQTAAAYEIHQEALALNEEVKSEPHAALIQAELCADAALAGKWEEAARYARQALVYRKYGVLPLVVSVRWLETEALLRAGEVELAREDARRWGEVIGRAPYFRARHLRSLAALAEWAGEVEEAVAWLEEAGRLAEAIGLPEEQRQIAAKLGELGRAIGEGKPDVELPFQREIRDEEIGRLRPID
jgi:tetratricopeptide (TPR) repeat protein